MKKIFLKQKKINILNITYRSISVAMLILSVVLLVADTLHLFAYIVFIIASTMIISPLGMIMYKAFKDIKR